jgi:hypothetical protein
MSRYSDNQHKLVAAILVISLCFSSLIGSTLALFTSEDGTIGIVTTSGDVEVAIVDALTGESLVGESLGFMTNGDQRDVLFEPGATFRTQGFKVENIGDIPVNFRLSVSRDKDIDYTEFDKAFEVWVTDSLTDPSAAEPLKQFVGRLEVGKKTDTVYYLLIKMKETAGNEFQNQEYRGIGVTVFAIQGNAKI